jgi:ribosomal-protein-alanine N-acetyltransferase
VAVGRRVLLRRPTARDAAAFLDLVRASRRLHHPWVAPPADPAAFAAWRARLRRPTHTGFLVCRRSDGAIVGVVNVSEIVRGHLQSAYLGYYADARHAGRGYMTEGLRLVVRHAFGPLGLHRLEANVQPGNRASRALARRCGFRREGYSPRYLEVLGRWRDHERWAITVEDVRGRRRVLDSAAWRQASTGSSRGSAGRSSPSPASGSRTSSARK